MNDCPAGLFEASAAEGDWPTKPLSPFSQHADAACIDHPQPPQYVLARIARIHPGSLH
jgi:hypothetical protein